MGQGYALKKISEQGVSCTIFSATPADEASKLWKELSSPIKAALDPNRQMMLRAHKRVDHMQAKVVDIAVLAHKLDLPSEKRATSLEREIFVYDDDINFIRTVVGLLWQYNVVGISPTDSKGIKKFPENMKMPRIVEEALSNQSIAGRIHLGVQLQDLVKFPELLEQWAGYNVRSRKSLQLVGAVV